MRKTGGCGGIADRRTIPGLLLAENAELVAVMDTADGVAEKVRAKYNAKYAYNDYNELLEAVKNNRSEENIKALAEWFERYGRDFWNGEYYDVSEIGDRLYPIYEEIGEDDYEIVGWELR